MVVILLLNVMEVYRVGGGAMSDRPYNISILWSSKECTSCACDLSVPSLGSVYV